jgi:hypothetical protein
MQRGNEVMSKLQFKIKSMKEKLDRKKEKETSMGEELHAKDIEFKESQHTISELNRTVAEKESENQRLLTELKNCQKQVSDCNSALEKNEKALTWLNEKLNEKEKEKSSSMFTSVLHQPAASGLNHSAYGDLSFVAASSTILPNAISSMPASTIRNGHASLLSSNSALTTPLPAPVARPSIDYNSPSPGAVVPPKPNTAVSELAAQHANGAAYSSAGTRLSQSTVNLLASKQRLTTVVSFNKENHTNGVVSGNAGNGTRAAETTQYALFSPTPASTQQGRQALATVSMNRQAQSKHATEAKKQTATFTQYHQQQEELSSYAPQEQAVH